jgi:hypothetical protein
MILSIQDLAHEASRVPSTIYGTEFDPLLRQSAKCSCSTIYE